MHDVVARVNDVGELVEQARLSPDVGSFGLPPGHMDSAGAWDAGDTYTINNSSACSVREDAND